MLTISKPTLFSADGLASRGQCNHDSPGWQLRWFDPKTPPVMIWQGAYKTCRHLQMNCVSAGTIEEVKSMVEELLNANSFTHFANQPTDAYPTPGYEESEGEEGQAPAGGGQARKKRKKKRH